MTEKVLRVSWGLPLDEKVYQEVGEVMVHALPLVKEVEIADSEGAVLKLELTEEQAEEIKKLRDTLLHIDVWFEEDEDPEQIENKRLMRWSKALKRRSRRHEQGY